MLAISNTIATSLCSAALAYRPYPRVGVPFTARGPDMVIAARDATRPATVTQRASHLLHRHVPPHIRQRPDRHHPERGSGSCHGDRRDVSEFLHHLSPVSSATAAR